MAVYRFELVATLTKIEGDGVETTMAVQSTTWDNLDKPSMYWIESEYLAWLASLPAKSMAADKAVDEQRDPRA